MTARWTSPKSLGSITLASREKLDNLIFVINCNLQRLDGPVRGNGKIIQELEAIFRGAGWNVIKVIWGRDWDTCSRKRSRRSAGAAHGRSHRRAISEIFRRERRLLPPEFLRHRSAPAQDGRASSPTSNSRACGWAGTIPSKFTPLTRRRSNIRGSPTVILAKTIKGYGLGEAGEGKNITHQQKKLNDEELRMFRSRFGIPIPDEELHDAPFYRPPDDSPEVRYLQERRKQLGGYMPERKVSGQRPSSR